MYPAEKRAYNSPEYERLWATAEGTWVLPLASTSAPTDRDRARSLKEFESQDTVRPAFFTNVDHWVRMPLADIIFTGVFRAVSESPKWVSIEMELSWVPHFLDRLDYTYTQRVPAAFWHRFKRGHAP